MGDFGGFNSLKRTIPEYRSVIVLPAYLTKPRISQPKKFLVNEPSCKCLLYRRYIVRWRTLAGLFVAGAPMLLQSIVRRCLQSQAHA